MNNITIELRRIHESVQLLLSREDISWPEDQLTNDAILLSFLVKRLVNQVHQLNNRLPDGIREDLCPECAEPYWSRPGCGLDFNSNYTRRVCSTCYTVRDEPARNDEGV